MEWRVGDYSSTVGQPEIHRRHGIEGLITKPPSTSIRLRNFKSCCSRETKVDCLTDGWGAEGPVEPRVGWVVPEEPRADQERGMKLLNDENESLGEIGEEKIAVIGCFEDRVSVAGAAWGSEDGRKAWPRRSTLFMIT